MIVSNVKKNLGDFSLCVDTFVVSHPGIYGLIGPNGSGKSTLAKIITGLLSPDSGTVDTEGLSAKDITYLSRKPYIMEDTVYNNLVYPLKLRNMKFEENEIAAFLDKMKFTERRNQRAKSLSGGEQQKLSFLRAVIFKPKLIVVDEAMTAMDMESLELFENTIIEEQEKEKSIWIIISHQMPHINRICKKIYSMFDGKLMTDI
ncbi:MAG: ABC transporter ATP-binding protein [Treponema sp.]|nr:ABC transporter ATP-binding protein [Treponema sp.]